MCPIEKNHRVKSLCKGVENNRYPILSPSSPYIVTVGSKPKDQVYFILVFLFESSLDYVVPYTELICPLSLFYLMLILLH